MYWLYMICMYDGDDVWNKIQSNPIQIKEDYIEKFPLWLTQCSFHEFDTIAGPNDLAGFIDDPVNGIC